MGPYKSIFIFLVTGDQGRSVVNYLLEDGYRITGLTRDPHSSTAQELARRGVKLVTGDMNDVSSYSAHLQGIDVAYINAHSFGILAETGYNEEEAIKVEVRQCTDAAKEAIKRGVRHLICPSLENFPNHETACYMKCKDIVKRDIQDLGLPATFIYTCGYYENAYKLGFLKKLGDGKFLLDYSMPDDARVPSFSVSQVGGWVKAILDDPGNYIGESVDACGDYVKVSDMANIIAELYSVQVDTTHVTTEQFYSREGRQKPTPQVWLNFKAYVEGYFLRDVAASKAVYTEAWTYRQWAEQSQDL